VGCEFHAAQYNANFSGPGKTETVGLEASELPSWVRRAARSRQQSRSCGGWFQSRIF